MIKITIGEMVNVIDTFNKLLAQECKGSIALKIARIARELDKEYNTFTEQRKKIIEKYCLKDKNGPIINGNEYTIDPKYIKESQSEFNALMDEEIEINCVKLDADEIENFVLSGREAVKLQSFLNE